MKYFCTRSFKLSERLKIFNSNNNNNTNNNNNNDNNNNDNNNNDNDNNNNNNGLLTDPLGGSSLLNYINYNNYKINQIKLFTNYAMYILKVEAGLQ